MEHVVGEKMGVQLEMGCARPQLLQAKSLLAQNSKYGLILLVNFKLGIQNLRILFDWQLMESTNVKN